MPFLVPGLSLWGIKLSGWESKPRLAIVVGKTGVKSGPWLEKLAAFCFPIIIRIEGAGAPVFLTNLEGKKMDIVDGFIGDYSSLARCPEVFAKSIKIDPRDTQSLEKWDDFFCRVFLRFDWKEHSPEEKTLALQKFQKKHKYLLMSLNPQIKDEMGGLAAKGGENYEKYGDLLKRITRFPARRGNQVNAIQHIFGYFSSQLSSEEKERFLEKLKLFQNEKLELKEIRMELKSLCKKYTRPYIEEQSFLEPFPQKILSIKPEQSSGK